MLAPISLSYPIRPAKRSLITGRVADLFGLPEVEPPHVVAENVALDVRPGELVLFTGPSGSGKSSLMREVTKQVNAVDVMALSLPDVPLVDALPGSLESRLDLLSACGLAEARLMLRTPAELSDGQRYRFRIAHGLAGMRSERRGSSQNEAGSILNLGSSILAPQSTILLDEFAAMLDRPLARVVAFNLRKLVTRTGIGVLAATTHKDIADDLNPDVHVRCHGDGHIDVERRTVKKNGSASTTTSGSRPAPSPIGRTSLGGITVRIGSPSSAV